MTTKRMWTAVEYLNLAIKEGACDRAIKQMRSYIEKRPNATAVQLIRWLHSGYDRQRGSIWPLRYMVGSATRRTGGLT